ncbi:MAG: hypothetical protein R6V59_03410 [Dehalococcoidia bacterium]
MGCLLIVPFVAAIAAIGIYVSTLLGFLLACFTTTATSMAALIGLVLLI